MNPKLLLMHFEPRVRISKNNFGHVSKHKSSAPCNAPHSPDLDVSRNRVSRALTPETSRIANERLRACMRAFHKRITHRQRTHAATLGHVFTRETPRGATAAFGALHARDSETLPGAASRTQSTRSQWSCCLGYSRASQKQCMPPNSAQWLRKTSSFTDFIDGLAPSLLLLLLLMIGGSEGRTPARLTQQRQPLRPCAANARCVHRCWRCTKHCANACNERIATSRAHLNAHTAHPKRNQR